MRLTVLTLVVALAGCNGTSPKIEVSDAWARATAPGQSSGAVYATILNDGGGDELISVSTGAGSAMLHSNDSIDGVARMRMMAKLPIPARSRVELAPGAAHVMLGGLKAPLVAGAKFPVTFQFAKAGPRTVEVGVVAAGAR